MEVIYAPNAIEDLKYGKSIGNIAIHCQLFFCFRMHNHCFHSQIYYSISPYKGESALIKADGFIISFTMKTGEFYKKLYLAEQFYFPHYFLAMHIQATGNNF